MQKQKFEVLHFVIVALTLQRNLNKDDLAEAALVRDC